MTISLVFAASMAEAPAERRGLRRRV